MTTFYIIMNIVMYGTIVGIMILLPYITRKNLAFGISIPAVQSHSKEILGYKKDYVKKNLLLGAVFILCIILPYKMVNANIASILNGITVILYLIGVYSIYYQIHKKVKQLKQLSKWDLEAKDIRVVDTELILAKSTLSPLWFMTHIMLMAVTGISIIINYETIPNQIPMQMDMAGVVTRYATKSTMSVAFPLIMQLVMLVVFVIIFLMISTTTTYIDPDNVALSKVQAKVFKREWARFILIVGFIMILLFGFIAWTMIGWVSMSYSFVITGVFVMVTLLYTLILSVKIGQSGNRVKGKAHKGTIINRDDDRYWKAGMFYFNKEDPSLFVEKRVSVGFTINFGRPLAIILCVALLVFIVGISLFVSLSV